MTKTKIPCLVIILLLIFDHAEAGLRLLYKTLDAYGCITAVYEKTDVTAPGRASLITVHEGKSKDFPSLAGPCPQGVAFRKGFQGTDAVMNTQQQTSYRIQISALSDSSLLE